MKKVLIIENFARFPWEEGNSRFNYIINLLDYKNIEIEFITSSFFHGEKRQRDLCDERLKKLNYKATLIKEPGYKKNVSLKRFYSHKVLANNLKKYFKTIDKPDLIYVAVPSLDVGEVVANYAKKNDIKLAIDIQDLWPEAFKMVLNIPILSDILFFPMKLQADSIYKKANYIISVSNTYAERAIKVNEKFEEKIIAYLGTDLDYFDKCKQDNNLEKQKDIFEIAYLGTLGSSYEIKSVIDAIEILNNKGIKNIKFSLFGNGPLQTEFEKYSKKKNVNCEFTGRLDYETMVKRLSNCDIAVNPIRKGSAASIINKVGDYAAAGIPVINTQESEEYKALVKEYNIGFNIENENPEQMAQKILELYNNEELKLKLGNNNRKLAEEKFDRRKTYLKIKELIENS